MKEFPVLLLKFSNFLHFLHFAQFLRNGIAKCRRLFVKTGKEISKNACAYKCMPSVRLG